MSNLAAQTGASLFLQEHASPYPSFVTQEKRTTEWIYDKTEGLDVVQISADRRITHAIAEAPCPSSNAWKILHEVDGFERWPTISVVKEIARRGIKGVKMDEWKLVLAKLVSMETTEKLCILERQ